MSGLKLLVVAIVVAISLNAIGLSVPKIGNQTAVPFDNSGNSPGNLTAIPVGQRPVGIAYDPSTGMVYSSNYLSGNISIINPATDTVVGTIDTGYVPRLLSMDPINGMLYVGNDFSNVITVVDPASRTVVGTITVGSSPTTSPISAIYDSYNHYFYAQYYTPNEGSALAVINASENVVNGSIDFGLGAGLGSQGIGITPWNDCLYVANWESNTVTLINGSNNTVIGTIRVGDHPTGTFYDPLTNMIYVTVRGYNGSLQTSVVIINPKTESVVSSVNDFSGPTCIALDAGDSIMAVTNFGSDNVGFINASNGDFLGNLTLGPAFGYTYYVLYCPHGDKFYVSCPDANVIASINASHLALSNKVAQKFAGMPTQMLELLIVSIAAVFLFSLFAFRRKEI